MSITLNDPSLLATKAYINGEWIDSDSGSTLEVHDPATGELLANMAQCGTAETRRAIEAAKTALVSWRQKTAKERSKLLRVWYELIIENQEDLAQILTAEQGKPLAESRGEVAYGANYFEWFSEEAKRIYGDVIAPPSNDKRIVCVKQPVGVVACITPWNFPSAMLARKVAPALAAGCTVVCKPANETPLSAFALGVLAERAGIPAGVVNMVIGVTEDIGLELTKNPMVRKVTFTGSTAVGKLLMEQTASTVKKTSMELGGNAPFIVFDDADLDAAVSGAMVCKYRNAGQTCVCANRVFVQAGVYDEFLEKLKSAVGELKMGYGNISGVTVGPLIHEEAAQNVHTLVEEAVSKGAKTLMGGQVSDMGACFYEPTILTDVSEDMRVCQEEIFGPIAPIVKFDTEEEAITMANNTDVGLAGYFYTKDLARTWRVAEALEYGIIGINEGVISNEMAPFGGIKESGSGREGSKYGIEDYVEIKYMCMAGIDS